MAAIGIIQEGELIFRQAATPFDLPAKPKTPAALSPNSTPPSNVQPKSTTSQGMGVAAPQIGIDRAAAVIRIPDGRTSTLLNPTVIEESVATDEQYEGCWSFFDVRGKAPRSLVLHVEHQAVDGTRRITIFERSDARLIDHTLII
jgi:peptide deformylase